MAYRRSYGGRGGRYAASPRRAPARTARRPARRRASGAARSRGGEMRLVLEIAPSSLVSRPGINPVGGPKAKPRVAKL